MKMLMYGGGSIGRGFIGPVFAMAGYQVVFVDVNKELIDTLNEKGEYHLNIVGDKPFSQHITSVTGILGTDSEKVAAAIADCDIMATSLGGAILPLVAPLIAKGFIKRMEEGGKPLDILICENLKNSAQILHQLIKDQLPPEYQAKMESQLGLIETAISRMVPVVAADGQSDILSVKVEAYDFIPVDKDGFKGEIPKVEQIVPYAPFEYYEERKLYLHNMSHAVSAYLGERAGYKYIWQAIEDPWIRLIVTSSMVEVASALSVKYGVDFNHIYKHGEDLIDRFHNRELRDTCERVGRDPMRKLEGSDRLAGAIKTCYEYGVYPGFIFLGIASALYAQTKDRAEAQIIASEHSRLNDEQTKSALYFYDLLTDESALNTLIRLVDRQKKVARGRFV